MFQVFHLAQHAMLILMECHSKKKLYLCVSLKCTARTAAGVLFGQWAFNGDRCKGEFSQASQSMLVELSEQRNVSQASSVIRFAYVLRMHLNTGNRATRQRSLPS